MWEDVFFGYVCPSIGVVMSSLMFAAPVNDLRAALKAGRLGSLNPTPWAVMTGNCLGWIAYAYYTRDPFILASNIPGILVSVWLNLGAAKLQYFERLDTLSTSPESVEESEASDTLTGSAQDVSPGRKGTVLAPQESLLLHILALWIFLFICVGWLGLKKDQQITAIGILVNINLLFFYGSPLQTMAIVIREKNSESIHRETMIMNWINTSFWVLYGFVARNDPVIYGPNAIGLVFGIVQGVLCCVFPSSNHVDVDPRPLLSGTEDEADAESEFEQVTETV